MTIRIPNWDWSFIGIATTIVAVIAGLLVLYVYLWPKDAAGNALPCTQYQTIYIPEKIGNSTYIMPIQSCVAWASPSPPVPR